MDDFKAVIFRIGEEEFGLSVNQVASIESLSEVKPISKMPEYMMGIIELSCGTIPLIDLRKALLGQPTVETPNTRMIVLNVEGKQFGVVVDMVIERLDIPKEWIQEPRVIWFLLASFLLGITRFKERLIMLIDSSKLIQDLMDDSVMVKESYQVI